MLYKQTNSFERRTKSLDFHNCFVAGQNETRSPWLRVGENSISGYNASSDDHFLVFDNDGKCALTVLLCVLTYSGSLSFAADVVMMAKYM